VNRRTILLPLVFVLLLAAGFVAGCATAPGQPRMQSALQHFRAARSELQRATADKGGHRARAISIIDEAIDQVQRGIDYARNH
jgi:hypothetical protein